MFDAIKFYQAYGISYKERGHKHCQPGWVQIACPLCDGNPGWHLGFDLKKNFYNCWRCGWHTHVDVVMALLRVGPGEAANIAKQFSEKIRTKKSAKEESHPISFLHLPMGTAELQQIHKGYLESRQFDASLLTTLWKLKGCGPIGPFKFRIITPIFFKDQLVSYQGRDITGKSDLKYKACKKAQEVIHHKHILYGLDYARGENVVVVEGVTDVWRLGPGAVATFGIKFKPQQIKLLMKFKRVFILYDKDKEARRQARKMETILSAFSYTEIVTDKFLAGVNDPAELDTYDAKHLMRELGL